MTIYLDANIFFYVSDTASTHHAACNSFIQHCKRQSLQLATSAETIQEIIHVSKKLTIVSKGLLLAKETITLVDELYPIEQQTITTFLSLVAKYPRLDARDVLHLASAMNHNVSGIASYDKKMKTVTEIRVATPEDFLSS